MKIMTICLCMGFFLSCTSQPLSVNYYLLHTPKNNVSNLSDETKPIAVLKLINVADYLRQSSLVMQIDQYQLYYSRQDVWAEKLQSSFYNALLQDLNVIGTTRYVASFSPEAQNADTEITITLEHFHATNISTVVTSGRYWLSVNDPKATTSTINKHLSASSHSFFFESQLKQDGYAHAVEQLRTLITDLAQQIEKDIAALPNN